MSMKKLAVITALQNYGGLNRTEMHPTPGTPPVPVQGLNVMLGGAMMSGIILVIFIMCYCCHKTQRKTHQTHLPSYWRENGALSMEIYTVEAQNCYHHEEILERPLTPGPPPAYESVVPFHNKISSSLEELPSYETAIKLQPPTNNGGYV